MAQIQEPQHTSSAEKSAGHIKKWDASRQQARGIHQLMMEQRLGRPLFRDEVVHHKDHDKGHNKSKNFKLLTRSEHMRLHRLQHTHCKVVRDRTGPVKCQRPHHAQAMCNAHHRRWLRYGKPETLYKLAVTKSHTR